MLRDRYVGPEHDIDALLQLPAGTFGQAYARFMTDNQLSVDYYPRSEPTDDLMYFKLRVLQTHDLWHVMLGAAPDLPGELEVIGFTIGQLERTLRRERLAVAFLYMMAVAYLTHSIIHPNWKFGVAWRRFWCGRSTGLTIRPLFSVKWERMWDQPIAELRAKYMV